MGNYDDAPDYILVEFFRATGDEVRLVDLGKKFLSELKIEENNLEKPFRIAVHKQKSKAGNAYFDYSQNSLQLPDGLMTLIRIENAIVPMSGINPSQKGNPTREGTIQILVGKAVYEVTVYITESKHPYYVKIIAKKPKKMAGIKQSQTTPKGGSIV